MEGDDEGEEKVNRNWSVLKSNPELRKTKVIKVSRICFLLFHLFLNVR